jgi:hypothetical protein
MSGIDVLIWVAFFGVIQALGWLFYWRFDESRFPDRKT